MDERLKKAISDITDAPKIPMHGGKKYTMVNVRVEAFRNNFGTDMGISTCVVKDDGKIVQVVATVTTPEGFVVGSGLAEEIRGAGHINKTSALENCETSAIGRALASLGLHGGEYASANEIDRAKEKEKVIKKDKKPEPKADPEHKLDPFTEEQVKTHIENFKKHEDMSRHQSWVNEYGQNLDDTEIANPELFNQLLNAWQVRKDQLNNTEGEKFDG